MQEDTNTSLFDGLPSVILIPIFSFLLDEAPLPDYLTLVCKTFLRATYTHPLIASCFVVRVDPRFKFKEKQILQIGKGGVEDIPGKKNVVVKSVEPFGRTLLPLDRMLIYHITEDCTWDITKPIFARMHKNVRFMIWNNPNYLQLKRKPEEKEEENVLPLFDSCVVFSLVLRSKWSQALMDINHSFPNLVFLQLGVEDFSQLLRIQSFLGQCDKSLRILLLDFTVLVNQRYQLTEDLTVTLPANLEMLRLTFVRKIDRFSLDLSQCKDNLKFLVIGTNTWPYVSSLFSNKETLPKKLKYLVFDDGDMYGLDWSNLELLKRTNQMDYLYAPSYANYAESISSMCVGRFPYLKEAKETLENIQARKILRELAVKERRHWLYGLFWSDQNADLSHIVPD